jgi:hypothetical protein
MNPEDLRSWLEDGCDISPRRSQPVQTSAAPLMAIARDDSEAGGLMSLDTSNPRRDPIQSTLLFGARKPAEPLRQRRG